MLTAHQAKGIGYAMSTEAELQFTVDVAQQTGALLAVQTRARTLCLLYTAQHYQH